MASNGEGVSGDILKFSLGGAEPLSHSRLQVGQPGHQSDDRPSRILDRFKTNDIAADYLKIAIAEDVQKRQAEEEIRLDAEGKG
jgi:hypothetical protein